MTGIPGQMASGGPVHPAGCGCEYCGGGSVRYKYDVGGKVPFVQEMIDFAKTRQRMADGGLASYYPAWRQKHDMGRARGAYNDIQEMKRELAERGALREARIEEMIQRGYGADYNDEGSFFDPSGLAQGASSAGSGMKGFLMPGPKAGGLSAMLYSGDVHAPTLRPETGNGGTGAGAGWGGDDEAHTPGHIGWLYNLLFGER